MRCERTARTDRSGAPGTPADGLNQAMADAMAAARRRRPGVRRLVLVQADLPAATGDQIRAALTASHHRIVRRSSPTVAVPAPRCSCATRT